MAKGYWIKTDKSISDINKVEAYAKLAGPAIELKRVAAYIWRAALLSPLMKLA